MNEPAKTLAKPKTQIRDLLQSEEFRQQVARALPRDMSGNAVRFARIALTATFKNPKLLDCSRESLLNCLLRLSELGIEPDGRRAHLIPYKDQCTLILDYKGIAELIRRNGEVVYIHCDVVGEHDHFDYRFGTNGKLDHVPATGDRGRILCAYSFVRFKDGSEEYDVMSAEDIERIRQRSRSANDGPWVTDWNEMAKKTIFRRHSKMLPLSPEVREAIERDDEPLTEVERFNHAKPATVAAASTATLPQRPRRIRQERTPSEFSFAESEPKTGPETPSAAQERVSAPEEPDTADLNQSAPETVLSVVTRLLSENGFSEEQLLNLLDTPKVNLRGNAKTIAELSESTLQLVIDEWENCQARLKEHK